VRTVVDAPDCERGRGGGVRAGSGPRATSDTLTQCRHRAKLEKDACPHHALAHALIIVREGTQAEAQGADGEAENCARTKTSGGGAEAGSARRRWRPNSHPNTAGFSFALVHSIAIFPGFGWASPGGGRPGGGTTCCP